MSIQILDPIIICGKNKPKSILEQDKKQPESSTKQLPSVFELPFSTASTAVDLSLIPKEQLLPSTTGITIARLKQSYID